MSDGQKNYKKHKEVQKDLGLAEINEPRAGWASEAYVFRVIDGDTIEVDVMRRFAIRLSDPKDTKWFNMPEKDNPKGQEIMEFLHALLTPCGVHKKVKIFIPAGQDSLKLMDINSFNRLLGEIWVDGKLLTDILKEKGYG